MEQQPIEQHTTSLDYDEKLPGDPVQKLVELGFDLKLSQMAWKAFNDYD
jgi:hypothetical protein